MRKVISVIVMVFWIQSFSVAYAATRGTEEYKKLVEYKKAQREKKASGGAHEKNFWQREAERSGLAGTAAMIGQAAGSIVPLDKPNSGKKS